MVFISWTSGLHQKLISTVSSALQSQPLQLRRGLPVQQPGPHPAGCPASARYLGAAVPRRRGNRDPASQSGVRGLHQVFGWSIFYGAGQCGGWRRSVVQHLSDLCLPTQVCVIGDCVGGILGFDALCSSSVTVSDSQSSSRRGSAVSVQVPPALQLLSDRSCRDPRPSSLRTRTCSPQVSSSTTLLRLRPSREAAI